MSKKPTPPDLGKFEAELRKILGQSLAARDRIEAESIDRGGKGLVIHGDGGSEREFEDVDIDALEVEDARAEAAAAALERIEAGHFGICTECDGKISPGRLVAMPYAEYCITCQERFEEEEQE